jgi:hypothetical protein
MRSLMKCFSNPFDIFVGQRVTVEHGGISEEGIVESFRGTRLKIKNTETKTNIDISIQLNYETMYHKINDLTIQECSVRPSDRDDDPMHDEDTYHSFNDMVPAAKLLI